MKGSNTIYQWCIFRLNKVHANMSSYGKNTGKNMTINVGFNFQGQYYHMIKLRNLSLWVPKSSPLNPPGFGDSAVRGTRELFRGLRFIFCAQDLSSAQCLHKKSKSLLLWMRMFIKCGSCLSIHWDLYTLYTPVAHHLAFFHKHHRLQRDGFLSKPYQ